MLFCRGSLLNRDPIMISWCIVIISWNICRNSFPSTVTHQYALETSLVTVYKDCWGKAFGILSGCLINNHIQCIKPNPPALNTWIRVARSLLPRRKRKSTDISKGEDKAKHSLITRHSLLFNPYMKRQQWQQTSH